MTLAKFLRNSSVTNRECEPRGFIDKNVCKMIRQKINVVFCNMNRSECSNA